MKLQLTTVKLHDGKSSESVQCAMMKACDACAHAQTWASYSALYRFGRLSYMITANTQIYSWTTVNIHMFTLKQHISIKTRFYYE